ncbi:hypothetical protein BCR32DRAFT_183992, partial [Anaeromyces robustus]
NLLKFLIDRHAININIKDRNGDIPLVYAIKHSRLQIVNYLIEHGADLYNVNHYGETI